MLKKKHFIITNVTRKELSTRADCLLIKSLLIVFTKCRVFVNELLRNEAY